jgi:hypothetical protein
MLSNIIDAKMNDFVVNQMRDDGLFAKIGY